MWKILSIVFSKKLKPEYFMQFKNFSKFNNSKPKPFFYSRIKNLLTDIHYGVIDHPWAKPIEVTNGFLATRSTREKKRKELLMIKLRRLHQKYKAAKHCDSPQWPKNHVM